MSLHAKTKNPRFPGFLALSSAWLMATAMATAQPAAGPDPYAFEDTVDVRLVQLEVRVVDRDGKAVSGLGAEDFEVFEDGAPVELAFFEEIRPPASIRPGQRSSASETAPPAAPQTPATESEASPLTTRHLIFYFDHTRLDPRSQKRALADIEELVQRSLVPAREILLLSQNRGSLEVVAPFGSSREELLRALPRLDEERSWARQDQREKRLMIQQFQEILQDARLTASESESPCQILLGRALPMMKAHEYEVRDRNVASLVQLERATSLVAGLPGVKALVYVSDGLEFAPGLDVARYVDHQCPGGMDLANPTGDPAGDPTTARTDDLAGLFDALTRRANAHRVTIYSLDAAGLRLGSLTAGVETAFVDQGAVNAFESASRINLRDGLSVLAERTGGRLLLNRNRFTEHLEGIAEEMVRYYSLAYEPPHGGDGGEHRVEVKVPGLRGVDVRHRRTYRDKGAEERLADRLHTAAYLGYVHNPLGITARAAVAGDRRMMVRVTVPIDQLQFLPVEGTDEARVVLQAVVRDDGGRTLDAQRRPLIIEKPPADRTEHTFTVELQAGEGPQVIAVALRDAVSQRASVLALSLDVPATPPAAVTDSVSGS